MHSAQPLNVPDTELRFLAAGDASLYQCDQMVSGFHDLIPNAHK